MSKLNTLLAAELSAALRTGRFWSVVARNAIPVAGVFLLGWSAVNAVLYYLIETWLFFSLRASVEITFDSDLREKHGLTGRQLFAAAAKRFLVVAPLFGLIIFMLTVMVFVALAAQWSWAEMAAADFLGAVLALAVFLFIEVVGFGRRYLAGLTDREDQLREGAMFYRTACLVLVGVPAFLLSATGYAAEVLVLVLALASIWVEGAPRHVTKLFGMRGADRRRLFRRVT